jgi:hypothetical protein
MHNSYAAPLSASRGGATSRVGRRGDLDWTDGDKQQRREGSRRDGGGGGSEGTVEIEG